MRNDYEVALRFTNTEKGFEVTVNVENKETRKTAEKKDTFSDMPKDFETLIMSAIEECER